MMQQQQMLSNAPSIYPTHITTEQIQQCLDENKQLILLIMENQNVGKFAECAPFQAQLQKNLMYLAKIADAQPPGSGGPASFPMSPQTATQQGYLVQHSQQQPSPSPYGSKMPFQLSEQQQQLQSSQFQQQQFIQGQMGMRAIPNTNIYQTGYGRNMMDMRGGNKQDAGDAET